MAERSNNIFNHIDKTICDGLKSGFRDFYWNLPRRSGTTTWFLNRIIKDLDAGLKVLYLSNRAFRHIEGSEKVFNHKNAELFTTSCTVSNPVGMKFDRIYLDTYSAVDNKFQENKGLYLHTLRQTLTSDGYMVAINSSISF